MLANYLTFSDAAKFADIARTFLATGKYGQSFTFWASNPAYPFSSVWTPPVMPFSILAFFRLFGVNDLAVVATSLFYLMLTLIFTFLLAKKIFKTSTIAVLSVLAIGFNYD